MSCFGKVEEAWQELYQTAGDFMAVSHDRFAAIGRRLVIAQNEPDEVEMIAECDRMIQALSEQLMITKPRLDAARERYDEQVIKEHEHNVGRESPSMFP